MTGAYPHILLIQSCSSCLLVSVIPRRCLNSINIGHERIREVRRADGHHVVEYDSQSPHIIQHVSGYRVDAWEPAWQLIWTAAQVLRVQQWRG